MKKLALLAAVSFLFVACNSEAPKPEVKNDTTVVAKPDTTVKLDTAKKDTVKKDTVKADTAKKDTAKKAEKKPAAKATATKAK
ncbi:MAG: hypothetical protein IPK50_23235 [Fibrobacterota bacterium]|nr:hypothetical protein [Fibrobacterota bacterium]QQS05148.1 MAG: hypothetical protein IPK50_23235 [Fibrobacterota bacterium]